MRHLNKPFALIIEDYALLANTYAVALNNIGFDIEIVTNGSAALTRLAATKPTLVVLDLSLPDISGFEVLHYIRTEAALSQTPVIFTMNGEISLSMQNVEERVNQVLIKPIVLQALSQLVEEWH